MMVPFLDLPGQYQSIKTQIDEAIDSVITSGAFIGGPFVTEFESKFAEYIGVSRCVGVGNGTDALELALEALELPNGCEVLVPANSWISTAEAVTRAGHIVRFVDCDPYTYNIDVNKAVDNISRKTAAVIPVHLYGQPCDMDALMEMARSHGLRVVEDCAQAHAATFDGKRVGQFGDAAAFSFYPGKNLGAYGDAGAVVSNDDALVQRCRMIANHGRLGKHDHTREGRNSRLDGLQAAVLNVKLSHLDHWTEIRRQTAANYNTALANVDPIVVPQVARNVRHVYHLYVIQTEDRDELRQHLTQRGIGTGIHYPKALPKLEAYSRFGQGDTDLNANMLDQRILSLPMGDHMTPEMSQEVAEAVAEYYEK